MINNTQKRLPHKYARFAGLNDPTYRQYLRSHAGVDSCADGAMDQSGFESLMAALETVLFARVRSGEVNRPYGLDEFYWRRKLPKEGWINSRQAHKLAELWSRLQAYLSPGAASQEYLDGIISHAIGKEAHGWMSLTTAEAACVIDALADRLSHAFRSGHSSPSPEQAGDPSDPSDASFGSASSPLAGEDGGEGYSALANPHSSILSEVPF